MKHGNTNFIQNCIFLAKFDIVCLSFVANVTSKLPSALQIKERLSFAGS